MVTKLGEDKVVVSHSQCTDGHCAAWLLHLLWPDASFFFINPNDKPPSDMDVRGKDVVIADVVFSREDLIRLHGEAKSLVVLDHHQSNRAALEGLDFCKFDMQRSGAKMVYDHFEKELRDCLELRGEHRWRMHSLDSWVVRRLVDHVSDYDTWQFNLDDSHEIHAALSSYPLTFEAWDALFAGRTNLCHLVDEGETLVRYRRQLVNRMLKDVAESVVSGQRVRHVNSCVLQSETCEAIYERDPDVIACAWAVVDRGGKKAYRYSFRSKAGVGPDVSKFAATWGGGGHRHSAGATTEDFILG